MLVLSRRQSESIRIHTSDGIIEISVERLDGHLVKLGFDAPKSIGIFRSEIDPTGHGRSHQDIAGTKKLMVLDLEPSSWFERAIRSLNRFRS